MLIHVKKCPGLINMFISTNSFNSNYYSDSIFSNILAQQHFKKKPPWGPMGSGTSRHLQPGWLATLWSCKHLYMQSVTHIVHLLFLFLKGVVHLLWERNLHEVNSFSHSINIRKHNFFLLSKRIYLKIKKAHWILMNIRPAEQ